MKNIIAVALVAGLGIGCGAPADESAEERTVEALAGTQAAPAQAPATQVTAADVDPAVAEAAGEIVVYKSPTCGCCTGWMDHMEASGFEVRGQDVSYHELAQTKQAEGLPGDLGSCHTALIDGYTVEGHVPAEVVELLLTERPDVKGIAVPGMPIGSPGMEGPNPEAYRVISFDEEGNRRVFAEVDAAGNVTPIR